MIFLKMIHNSILEIYALIIGSITARVALGTNLFGGRIRQMFLPLKMVLLKIDNVPCSTL